MIRRYLRIEGAILQIQELDPYLPTARVRRTILETLPHLNLFNSIPLNLQKWIIVTWGLVPLRSNLERLSNHAKQPFYNWNNSSQKILWNRFVQITGAKWSTLLEREKYALLSLQRSVVEVEEGGHEESKTYFDRLVAKRKRLSQRKSSYILNDIFYLLHPTP